MFCSADSRDDAISTLSQIYDVSSNEICTILANGAQDNNDWSNRPMLVWYMGSRLGRTANLAAIDAAAYYHRTRFDGTQNWFAEGLLDPECGAMKMVAAMRPHIPGEIYSCVRESARSIFSVRASLVAERGPSAFDVFDYAQRATQTVMDYSVPEFITDLCARNVVGAYELRSAIQRHLIPVIVKFRAVPTDLDDYVAGLWCFLYRIQNLEDGMRPPHICTQPQGVVKAGDILELIRCE